MATKASRSAAKGRFTRACNLFESALDDKKVDLEDISLRFKDVEKAWVNVEEKHDGYIAGLEEPEETEGRWLDEPQERFYSLRKRYVKYKLDFNVDVEMKNLERARDVEYDTFKMMMHSLGNSINGNYSHESICTEKRALLNQFEEVKRKHSEFCKRLPDNEQKTTLKFIDYSNFKLHNVEC